MQIAYFVNQYPRVSHSFIRREILALENLGFDIQRYSLRRCDREIVDAADQREADKTRYLLNAGLFAIPGAVCTAVRRSPIRCIGALCLALRVGWRSDRGMVRHIAYWLEACLLAQWLMASDVAHVHAHFGTNSATVVWLAQQLGGPPFSFTVHGPEEFDKPEFLALQAKIHQAKFVVAISAYGRSQLYRWAKTTDWPKIKLVRCGLEPNFGVGALVPIPTEPRLVCVGRLCAQKGQLLLLRAVKKLLAAGQDLQLILAGDGPMRPELESWIEQMELGDRVQITGWLSGAAVRDEILRARALVLPSFAEGLPVVLMEAMALGRPVLSTYVAGIPELVIPGETGWLIPAGCEDALVEGLKQVLSTPTDKLAAMGRSGRARVGKNHNLAKEAQKLAKLISR
jgi:glycosyltransferase involved in cell wall biosynthesis